ncbi:MAG: PIN domain-containing protein [Chloroflexota bacterium]|nr:MAG: PIN domain-containing protein [Chloroflexota bacterium]
MPRRAAANRIPRSRASRRVFIDTSAFGALADENDDHHQDAIAILDRLVEVGYGQFTSNTVVVESHALIVSGIGINAGLRFLSEVEASRIARVRVRPADEQAALEILFRYDDKDFSFADATSFALMRRLGITLAFTFDSHFAQMGFIIATAENV